MRSTNEEIHDSSKYFTGLPTRALLGNLRCFGHKKGQGYFIGDVHLGGTNEVPNSFFNYVRWCPVTKPKR